MRRVKILKPRISIIVPILNEEKFISKFLEQFDNFPKEIEIILIDGGSSDLTVELVSQSKFPIKISPKKGRAVQMNFGASLAKSQNLLFLHSDVKIALSQVEKAISLLEKDKVFAGAFGILIDSDSKALKTISQTANQRSKFSGIAYGDQGLFLKKENFKKIGGFPEVPLGEDIKISQEIKKMDKITFLDDCLKISPRRWQKEGILFVTLRNWFLATLLICGVNPQKIVKLYPNVR